MRFKVRLTRDAQADLDRLFDFPPERELAHESGDLTLPTRAIAALRSHIPTLKTSSSTCRQAGQSPFPRELNVPLERPGCISLFESEDQANVAVLAVRHQLEDDDH